MYHYLVIGMSDGELWEVQLFEALDAALAKYEERRAEMKLEEPEYVPSGPSWIGTERFACTHENWVQVIVLA